MGYGLSNDPDYPNFYYSMAYVYAERNQMDGAMDYVSKALARKVNLIAGKNARSARGRFFPAVHVQGEIQEVCRLACYAVATRRATAWPAFLREPARAV